MANHSSSDWARWAGVRSTPPTLIVTTLAWPFQGCAIRASATARRIPFRGGRQVVERVEPQEDEELLPTEPIDGIFGADRVLDHGHDRLEHGVAGEMPELVVDALEVVEIDRDEAMTMTEAIHPGTRGSKISCRRIRLPAPVSGSSREVSSS